LRRELAGFASSTTATQKLRMDQRRHHGLTVASMLQFRQFMTHKTLALIMVTVMAVGAAGRSRAADSTPQKKTTTNTPLKYRIDAKKSRFIVETETSGLSSMFGHDHKIEASDFSGTATFTLGALSAGASLQMLVRAASLHLIAEDNIGERQAVESALRQDVLETDKYPEITFKTSAVTSARRGDGTYDVRLTGDLSLHGVRKRITIPARVSLQDDGMHAIGGFGLRQTDFNITPFSFVSGTVTIKDQVTISFDLVADRS
jgi:polyisoprenoid-binding protein YceI